MKNRSYRKTIFVLAVFLLVLVFSSCDNANTTPEPEYFTVSFVANKGNDDFYDQTVLKGDCAEDPGNPVREAADMFGYAAGDGDGIFIGWYSNRSLVSSYYDDGTIESFDFDTPISSDITLYAMWELDGDLLDLLDVSSEAGPGEGNIFYYNKSGFVQKSVNDDLPDEICYFLEAAMDESKVLIEEVEVNETFPLMPSTAAVDAYGEAIGTGRFNTSSFHSSTTHNTPAADYCYNFDGGGMNDWFLPSKDELNELYNKKGLFGNFQNDRYWTSTQDSDYPSSHAWYQDFSDGSQGVEEKEREMYVRPMRAF